jgi:hypothetical protein
METKGLVLKVTDEYVTVLCDDGKYRNLPLRLRISVVGERIPVQLNRKKWIPI